MTTKVQLSSSRAPAQIELIAGQAVDIDLPIKISIRMDRDPEVRLTAVMLPVANGVCEDEGILVTDLPQSGGMSEIQLDLLPPGAKNMIHLIATKNGVEIPLADAGEAFIDLHSGDDRAMMKIAGAASLVHIACEVYLRDGRPRFKVVDQGYKSPWSQRDKDLGADLTLASILQATKIEWLGGLGTQINEDVSSVNVPIVEPVEVEIATQPKAKTSNAKSHAAIAESSSGGLPTMPCEMLYYSQRHGSSRRIVQITSRKDDTTIWARATDGRQVKQFKITGIRELVDIETGEDMLPVFLAALA